jgi:hypothetical protein
MAQTKQDKPKKQPARKLTDEQLAAFRAVTDCFQECFIQYVSHNADEKPPWGSREGQAVRNILRSFNWKAARVCDAIRAAFKSKNPYVVERRDSIVALLNPYTFAKADREALQSKAAGAIDPDSVSARFELVKGEDNDQSNQG